MEVKVIKVKEGKSLGDILSAVFDEIEKETLKEEVVEDVNKGHEPELSMGFFIERIAMKKGWKPEKVENYLNSIDELYPQAAFSIMLREIAVYLDSKYKDHIENSDEIYTVSTLDGRIHKINKKAIKNFRNFAAFRTLEDAKTACNILRVPLKDMFSTCTKETEK